MWNLKFFPKLNQINKQTNWFKMYLELPISKNSSKNRNLKHSFVCKWWRSKKKKKSCTEGEPSKWRRWFEPLRGRKKWKDNFVRITKLAISGWQSKEKGKGRESSLFFYCTTKRWFSISSSSKRRWAGFRSGQTVDLEWKSGEKGNKIITTMCLGIQTLEMSFKGVIAVVVVVVVIHNW